MRQHGPHSTLQERVEAESRVLELSQLGERDRALGKAFEHEEVELATPCKIDRRVDPITLKTSACTNPDDAHAETAFARAGANFHAPTKRASAMKGVTGCG